MKKLTALLLALMLVLGLAACGGGGSGSQAPGSTPAAGSSQAGGDASTPPAASDEKIAIICETVGTERFLTQVVEAANASKDKYGFTLSIMECIDDDAFDANARAAIEEDYTLILGVGWKSANAISTIATEFPDKAEYAIIDSTVENENVTCITFKEQEAAYVMGVLIANCFAEDELFGYVGAYQNQKDYCYRWGFTQGLNAVLPDAQLVSSFVGDYNDPVTSKEQALQQATQGCRFIYGAAASGNEGIFALALERGDIYSIGQDADVTTADNPYVLSSQLKNTGECTTYVLDHYFAGTLEDGVSVLGLAERAVGVVHVTVENAATRNADIITDEAIAAARKANDDIVAGTIVLEVPDEAAA